MPLCCGCIFPAVPTLAHDEEIGASWYKSNRRDVSGHNLHFLFLLAVGEITIITSSRLSCFHRPTMKLLIILALAAVAMAEQSCPSKLTSAKWLCPSYRLGVTPECPATSCKRILELNPFAVNGKYWFRIESELTVFPAFCDMDNGGFMMVVRVPKGYKPIAREASNPNDVVSKPHTFNDILDTIVDLNEGKLHMILEPKLQVPVVYKNRAWRHFDSLDIKRVRLCLLKNKKIVKDLEFNAVAATKKTWFTLNRLVKKDIIESWEDIVQINHPFFDLSSSTFGSHHPRDLLLVEGDSFNSRTCATKLAWMVGINHDSSKPHQSLCAFEKVHDGLHVLFSKGSIKVNFSDPSKIDVADEVIIMMK
eukprot:scpid82990/ scgid11536/ 